VGAVVVVEVVVGVGKVVMAGASEGWGVAIGPG